VHLISISPEFEKIKTSTFIVLAGRDTMDMRDFESFIQDRFGGRATSALVPEKLLNEYMWKSYSVVLRDDYAPVDNLIAPVFEERFGYNRKQR
jgi:hypothetical protein